MRSPLLKTFAALLVLVAVAGCDRIPGLGGAGTAIIDLAVIAKATGQEELIQQKAQAAREQLNTQLADTAQQLEGQLAEERDKLGESPSAEQQQQFQQLAAQAQQQYAQAQQRAQQQAQQFENNLVMELREKIKPVAQEVATARGVSVIFLADATLFWNEPTADITDEVLAQLRADPSILADEPVPEEPAADAPATEQTE